MDDNRQRMIEVLMGSPQPSRMDRGRGLVALREQMGGDPAFWGPLNRMLFGVPLRPEYTPQQVQEMMRAKMQESQGISDAVPRGY